MRRAAPLLILLALSFLAISAETHPDENGDPPTGSQPSGAVDGSDSDDEEIDDEAEFREAEELAAKKEAALAKPRRKVREGTMIRPHLFHPASDVHECDRALCREARDILGKDILPLVEAKGYELPPSCPLAKDNDRFHQQETMKQELRNGNFKCAYCRKTFRSEKYIDNHMDNRHHNYLPQKATVCLADLCDILHCPSIEEDHHCHSHLMMYKKMQCQTILHSCFPADTSKEAHELYDEFSRLFCKHLSCDERAKRHRKQKKQDAQEAKPSVKRVLYWILVVMVAFLILIFYVGVCLWKREAKFSNDLQRLSSSRHASRLKFWNKKVKGY